MRGVAVAGIDDPLGLVELRLVGDVANHTRLRAGAEQGSLRALEHFDTLDIGRIDVEVAAGQLSGLFIEVDRDVREASRRTGGLLAVLSGRQAAHVNETLSWTLVCHGDVGQKLDVVVQCRDIQLPERLGGQRRNGNRHVLHVFRAALRRHGDLLNPLGRLGIGCGRSVGETGATAAQDQRDRIGQLRIRVHFSSLDLFSNQSTYLPELSGSVLCRYVVSRCARANLRLLYSAAVTMRRGSDVRR